MVGLKPSVLTYRIVSYLHHLVGGTTHHTGEEVFEPICAKMTALHDSEDPHTIVRDRLLESGPSGSSFKLVDPVTKHAIMCELPFLRTKPSCSEWGIRKHRINKKGGHPCCRPLNDEKPLPSGQSSSSMKLKDPRGDESGESGCEDVTGIEDGNAGC